MAENGRQLMAAEPESEVQLAPIALGDLEKSIAQAEKYMSALARIRRLSIGMTSVADWTNQGGNPYLLKSGCDKIAGGFGIQVYDTRGEKEVITDDKGEYIMYTFAGNARWQNNVSQQIGICSTRDDFFALRNGEYLPLSEVDITDVKKKAFTNFLNRIIKALLGLSFTWQEIDEYSSGRITKETVTGVAYHGGSKGGAAPVATADDVKIRKELTEMLMEIANGDKDAAREHLIQLTAFEGRDGKQVAGIGDSRRLSGKRLSIAYDKAKKEYEEFKKMMG